MEMNYCRRCGAALSNESTVYRCKNGHLHFLNPKPTVGVVFIRSDNRTLVLSERGIEPRKGELDTFGGFVDMGESFEQAILREIHEETSLGPSDFSPLHYLGSAPSDYRYDNEDTQVLSVFFYAYLNNTATLVAADDVAKIVEIDIDAIDMKKITANDVSYAIRHLKERFDNNEL